MTLDDLKTGLGILKPGQMLSVSYAVYELIFSPGEPDELARTRAWALAEEYGCTIKNLPSEKRVRCRQEDQGQEAAHSRAPKTRSTPMSQKLNTAIAVIGIDIGKNSFHVVGHDERGAIVLRQKWSRGQVEARLANMPPCQIGLLRIRFIT